LRAIDIRTGRVLKSILTSKTIYSYQLDSSFYRFVSFKKLLEAEAGYTRNEPAQLCVLNAIEAAVIQMIVQGVKDNIWQLNDPSDIDNPIIQDYMLEFQDQITQLPN
jgi:curli production assembly/transport component CsgG